MYMYGHHIMYLQSRFRLACCTREDGMGGLLGKHCPEDGAGEFERRAAHGYHHHEKGHIQKYGQYMKGVTALVESAAEGEA